MNNISFLFAIRKEVSNSSSDIQDYSLRMLIAVQTFPRALD